MNKYKQIAEMHYNQIKTGFLNKLGLEFLELIYKYIDEYENSFIIYKIKNENVIGFISGTEDADNLYIGFKDKYFLKIIWIIFKRLCLKPSIVKGIFETMNYNKKTVLLPKAELISIAVDNDYKGKGIASDLMKDFFNEMDKRGIESVKVTVGADNIRANEYYRKWGFERILEIEVHKGIRSNVYVRRDGHQTSAEREGREGRIQSPSPQSSPVEGEEVKGRRE